MLFGNSSSSSCLFIYLSLFLRSTFFKSTFLREVARVGKATFLFFEGLKTYWFFISD